VRPLPDSVKAFIDAAHVCRIATAGDDGEPHVIPVCPAFDGENLIIDIGHEDRTARALRTDPRIAVVIDVYDDDWTKLKKVVLRCRAEALTGPAQTAAWGRISTKYPQHTTVNWQPRLTLLLRPYAWRQEGLL
jgi:nitroimidazol reductase NimA-like FMN-containing flavoprotein (pyridoxamine 5'-phosphate oxidase superfamily)